MHAGPSWLPALSLLSVLGLTSVVVGMLGWVPQLIRIRLTGDVAGVSVAALVNSLVSTVGWTLYGVHLHDWWVIAQSLGGLAPALVTLGTALRAGGSRAGMRLPVIWATTLLLAAGASVVVDDRVITVVLGCSVLWLVVPAVTAAWQAADVSGIAAGMWVLVMVNGGVCGAYGLAAHVPANAVYAVVAITGSGAILVRLAAARSSRARASVLAG